LEAVRSIGFDILDLDYSPIRGPEGNIEYLAYIEKPIEAPESGALSAEDILNKSVVVQENIALSKELQDRINEVVAMSHNTL